MKKTTLFATLMTLCSIVLAQAPVKVAPLKPTAAHHIACEFPKAKSVNTNVQAKKAVVWSETFAAGIPAGWTNVGTPALALWEYRGPTTTPTNTTGGRGDCSGGVPIASPTQADGFVIFDSNFLDPNAFCGGGNSGAAAAPQTSSLTTDAIDLSAESAIQLTFWTDSREFDATANVNISVDGGSTFTNVWEAGLGANESFAGKVIVNITAIAANQADVRIQFEWLNGDYYEWMIDDVEIETPPNNDLVLNDIFFNTTGDPTNQGTRYFQIPYRQAQLDTLTFGAAIKNQGGAAQPNTKLTVTVAGQGGYSDASVPATLAVNTEDSVNVLSSSFVPNTGLGTYNVTFDLSSDSVDFTPADNQTLFSFDVTDTVYARDNGDNPMGWQSRVTALQARASAFEIRTQDTATSISVVLGGLGTVGAVISLHLWDTALTAPIASNSFYTVQATDFGVWRTFDIPDVALVPGVYYAGIEVVSDTAYFHIDNEVPFPMAPIQTYVINDATDGTGGGGQWFTQINNIPFLRLNTTAPSQTCAMSASAGTVTAVSCLGGADGAVSGIVPTGGTAPYTYAWSPSGGSNADASGLVGGTYTLTITDAAACIFNVVAIVSEPDALTLAGSGTDVTCNGGTDGVATVTTTGGTAPLTYLWNDPGTQNTATAAGLAAGTYRVVVTDGAGCGSDSVDVVISEPVAMTLTFNTTTALCGLNGSATVNVTGGLGPFTYAWNDPAAQTDSNAVGLLPGTFTATVTDGNGCIKTSSVTVAGTPGVVIDSVGFTAPSACGLSDGSAYPFFTGGVAPIFYLWNDPLGQITDTATGLPAGSYQVTVTDGNACSDVATVTVADPGAPTLLLSGTTDASCMGGSDGTASVLISGGTAPYTYTWNDPLAQNTANADSLAAGAFTLTVIDGGGCTALVSATIGEPTNGVVMDSITSTDISCNGGTNGTLNAFSSGGTGTHSYSWSPTGATISSVTGAGAGTHIVTVTDANGCSVVDSAVITEPSALALSTTFNDVSCSGAGDGSIDLTVTGGTGTYTYLWNPGGLTPEDPSNLAPNAYSVLVTDANGCTANTAVTISEPTALSATAAFTNETVAGANDGTITVTPSGGVTPYSPSWIGPAGFTSTSLTLVNLAPGTYQLTLTDASGCTTSLTQIILDGVIGILEVVNNVEFKVYPNPSTGQFVVELNNLDNGEYKIEIRNIIGQLVITETVNDSNGNFYKNITLDTGKNGVYFISLVSEAGKITKKLVVY
ncbi:MAG: T9SS type A sorting domain-containing protein [Flavobacteriales bacterium]|nr:T9SS type A sorting domain-containing protein [Flavobacteriales bacterium]